MHVFSLSFLTLRSWGAWLVNWTRFFSDIWNDRFVRDPQDNIYIYHDNAGIFMDLQARPPAIVVYTIQYVYVYVYTYIYIYIHTTINIYKHLQHIYSAFISQVSWYTPYSTVLPKTKRTKLKQFMYLLLHPSCSLSGGASRSVFWALWCLLCSTWPWQRVPCFKGARRGGEVSQQKEPKQWRSWGKLRGVYPSRPSGKGARRPEIGNSGYRLAWFW